MNHVAVCRHCNDVIMKSLGDETKIRGKIVVFRGDTAYAVCKSCGVENEVPLTLNKSQKEPTRLFVPKKS